MRQERGIVDDPALRSFVPAPRIERKLERLPTVQGRTAQRGSSGWLDAIHAVQPIPSQTATAPERSPERIEQSRDHVRVSPSLMNAISRAGMDTVGRVWLTLRAIDAHGRGWLHVDDTREKLTDTASIFRVCGKRRLRQILNDGEGQLWERDRRGRLWIYGTVRVCQNFDIERLSGDNIEVNLDAITANIKAYRATMYGAFLEGKTTAPISRETITSETGYSERSQREFDQIISTKITRNFSIDTVQNDHTKQEHIWAHGRGHFAFTDYHGKQGEAGRTYNARRLPNTYETQLQSGTRGRKKKINRKLRIDLVSTWEQGNDTNARLRVFHTDARTLGAAMKKQQSAILRHSGRRDYGLWTTYEVGAMGGE